MLIAFFVVIWNQKSTTTNQKIASTIPTAKPAPSITQYSSKFFKLSFSFPSSYTVSELDNDINLKNEVGEISIERIGTNNDTIEGYLFGIAELNKLQITDKQKIKINGMDVISCKIKSKVSDNPESRFYFFNPAPWRIYSISTNIPELFSDLDQIARSFRYEP